MPPDELQSGRQVDGVFEENLSRIMLVMREHYPKVLAANRFFEEETGIHNELGTNNLNDALSHLGTLFEQAHAMTPTEQAHEVHDFEGHLRRGMMESYEQVFRLRMGQVAKLWKEHERVARPLQVEGVIRGVPSLSELDRLRRRCRNLLDDGRAAKRGHDWTAWDRGTEALAEACRTASELHDALDQCLAAADEHTRGQDQENKGRRRFRTGLAAGAAFTVIGIPLGFFANEWWADDKVAVPDVVGVSVPAAIETISDDKLTIEISPSGSTSGRCAVERQTPAKGASADVGDLVRVTVRCP